MFTKLQNVANVMSQVATVQSVLNQLSASDVISNSTHFGVSSSTDEPNHVLYGSKEFITEFQSFDCDSKLTSQVVDVVFIIRDFSIFSASDEATVYQESLTKLNTIFTELEAFLSNQYINANDGSGRMPLVSIGWEDEEGVQFQEDSDTGTFVAWSFTFTLGVY